MASVGRTEKKGSSRGHIFRRVFKEKQKKWGERGQVKAKVKFKVSKVKVKVEFEASKVKVKGQRVEFIPPKTHPSLTSRPRSARRVYPRRKRY